MHAGVHRLVQAGVDFHPPVGSGGELGAEGQGVDAPAVDAADEEKSALRVSRMPCRLDIGAAIAGGQFDSLLAQRSSPDGRRVGLDGEVLASQPRPLEQVDAREPALRKLKGNPVGLLTDLAHGGGEGRILALNLFHALPYLPVLGRDACEHGLRIDREDELLLEGVSIRGDTEVHVAGGDGHPVPPGEGGYDDLSALEARRAALEACDAHGRGLDYGRASAHRERGGLPTRIDGCAVDVGLEDYFRGSEVHGVGVRAVVSVFYESRRFQRDVASVFPHHFTKQHTFSVSPVGYNAFEIGRVSSVEIPDVGDGVPCFPAPGLCIDFPFRTVIFTDVRVEFPHGRRFPVPAVVYRSDCYLSSCKYHIDVKCERGNGRCGKLSHFPSLLTSSLSRTRRWPCR
ncbi:hypothetical protein [Prevotella sp. HUN102]|uniref:hypothetical protein n=1 Tax=Prevotella sp. HUN102 TaxID=1392486 RepID=UPI0012DC13B8|nr:hypothetical protein [Prevotella sp. HUN102]